MFFRQKDIKSYLSLLDKTILLLHCKLLLSGVFFAMLGITRINSALRSQFLTSTDSTNNTDILFITDARTVRPYFFTNKISTTSNLKSTVMRQWGFECLIYSRTILYLPKHSSKIRTTLFAIHSIAAV